ncbi:hypothetical protein F3157_16650 [Virgibacillus dakarensis]|nr:hypothetical protein [Virgibacillus dakarensis]
MKGKMPLYGTIAGLIFFVFATLGIYGGVKMLLYFVLVPAIFILIAYFSFKLLPQLWASIIVASLAVFGVYFLFGLWSLTIIMLCYLSFLIFVNYVVKKDRWSSVAMNVASIVLMLILLFLVVKKNVL